MLDFLREVNHNAPSPPLPPLSADLGHIQKYGRLAAYHDADKADLYGVLTWNLMHLSKHGFNFAPSAGGITGLVDETTFFHPMYAGKEAETGGDLEKTLGGIIATQYVEVCSEGVLPCCGWIGSPLPSLSM